MNHYQNAEETYSGAKSLFDVGNFRLSINLSCLAIELFLKSRLERVENNKLIEYESLISDVKAKIYQRQYETLKYVNSQTIKLY